MEKKISLTKIIKDIHKSNFVYNCPIPLEYKSGIPVLKIVNSKLCLVLPFLKYKITGEVDKTQVFPIRYTVTVSLPDMKFVAFEDLAYNPNFSDTDFTEPVGLFRHDSIKQFTKQEYNKKRDELFGMYERIIASLLYDENYSEEDDANFSNLLNIMLEPSLKRFYSVIDNDFYNKYIF